MNNLKILLLLMLFAFAGNDAWAFDTKYYSYHLIDVKPSGAGKVYSTTKTDNGANTNFNACVDPPYTQTWHTGNSINTLYLLAKANDGYVFSHWEDQNGNTVSSSNPGQVQARCAQNNSDSGPGDYNGTYYAIFVPTQAVEVYTENADYGTASINNAQNEVGQTITLTAHENLFQHAFVGWRKESDGQIVSNENPYTFTISEQNKGKYYAVFRDDYNFYRIKNYETNRYMVATNDQGGISNLSSFSLISGLENVIYDAGSIVQVRIHYAETTAHTREYAIIVQGEDTQEITGAYLRMDRVEANELTLWEPNADGIRARDNGGANVSLGFASSADNTKWIFEKLDLDLNGSSYFSLNPAKLVQVGDKYYTTLRTSWNILIDPERTKPYVVTSVDETAGTFEMEPITGNIIPAGTPVIIETSSTDIEANRMVPTTTSGAVPSVNKLQTSTKYFPNQSVSASSNYKKLMVNSNGQLAFGGDALTTVNGNEAYLSVANEVVHDVQPVLTEITLANLLDKGKIGPNYKITDLTCVYAQNNVLYCKDDNNALKKSVKAEGEVDYIKQQTGFQSQDWDQSNWIAITVPEGSEITTSILDHRLNNVVGRLKSKVNPEFEATMMPTAGEPNAYDENTYITCNFSGEHQQGVVNGEEVSLFFVAPKPMEIAEVQWAMWDDALKKFIIPSAAQGSQLEGAFSHNFSMLEAESEPVLIEGHVYHFPALIKVVEAAQGNAPRLAASDSNSWMVYPLEWNDGYDDTPTAIGGMPAGKEVNRVVYYNLLGVASDHPFKGVNIVVTEYSDGSKSTRKTVVR